MKRAHSCYSPPNPRRDTSEEREKLRPSHPLYTEYYLTVVFISLKKYCCAEGTSTEGTLSAGGVSTGEDLLREQEASSNPILE